MSFLSKTILMGFSVRNPKALAILNATSRRMVQQCDQVILKRNLLADSANQVGHQLETFQSKLAKPVVIHLTEEASIASKVSQALLQVIEESTQLEVLSTKYHRAYHRAIKANQGLQKLGQKSEAVFRNRLERQLKGVLNPVELRLFLKAVQTECKQMARRSAVLKA